MEKKSQAVDALLEIALDKQRVMVERQRALEAISLFPDKSLSAFKKLEKKVDEKNLKNIAQIYIQRIENGFNISMSL